MTERAPSGTVRLQRAEVTKMVDFKYPDRSLIQTDRKPRGRQKRGFVAVVKEDMKVMGARKEDTEDRDGENWFHC